MKPQNRYYYGPKGVFMDCIGKLRVIVSKYDKKDFISMEPGEWVSLVESLDRRTRLLFFYIFSKTTPEILTFAVSRCFIG
jgi:hypothetical protein